MTKSFRIFLLTTAFFEGGAVMAAELLGAKLIAPYYGNSLYVWAGVLGVTLAGLASGYFAGSGLARRNDSLRKLFIILFAGALFTALMPLIARTLVEATIGMELRTGIVLSCFALLFVPLLCFGTISPLMIKNLLGENTSGRTTGNVYAISTVGGIVFTILIGFYFIPQAGTMITAYISGGLAAVFPLIYFTGRSLGKIR